MLLLLLLAKLAISSPKEGPPPRIHHLQSLGSARCLLGIDYDSIALSGTNLVSISIEGSNPVEVEPIGPLTDSPDWRVRAYPPTITLLPDGRQLWHQKFDLEPFQTGDVALPIKPIRFRTGNEVRDWTLTWPTSTIRVTTMVDKPELSSARPVTDVESLPPAPERSHAWWYVAGFVVVAAAAAVVALWLRRRRVEEYKLLSPQEWVAGELQRLEHAGPSAGQLTELANVLRQFLERQFDLTATRQTSAEFRAVLELRSLLPPESIHELFAILGECDLVKFAGAKPGREACETLLIRARTLVAAVGEVKQANPTA